MCAPHMKFSQWIHFHFSWDSFPDCARVFTTEMRMSSSSGGKRGNNDVDDGFRAFTKWKRVAWDKSQLFAFVVSFRLCWCENSNERKEQEKTKMEWMRNLIQQVQVWGIFWVLWSSKAFLRPYTMLQVLSIQVTGESSRTTSGNVLKFKWKKNVYVRGKLWEIQ